MSEHVKVTEHGGVLEICFTRADKKNALTNAMYVAAREALEAAQTNHAVKVVVFTAEGDAFTAGNDIAEFTLVANGAPSEGRAHEFIHAIACAEKPVVAAVTGLAVGVGTTMLLHCDLVFIAESATLATPFVNLGLAPEAASSLLLPARIGYQRAFAMFALGERVTGLQAVDLGLAYKALPAFEVHAAAMEAANTLAAKAPGSLVSTKRLMRDVGTLLTRIDAEGDVFQRQLCSPEAREAFKAFAERRAPDFSNLSN